MAIKGLNTHSSAMKRYRKVGVDLLDKTTARKLIKYYNEFIEFWLLYCEAYSTKTTKLDYTKFADKDWKQAGQRLRRLKSDHAGKDETTGEWRNEVLIQTTKQKKTNKSSKANTDIELIDEVKVERKEIKEIRFASQITVEAVKRIEMIEKFKAGFVSEYLETVGVGDSVGSGGGELGQSTTTHPNKPSSNNFGVTKTTHPNKPRSQALSNTKPKQFNFQHLNIGNTFRTQLAEMADKLQKKILRADAAELRMINQRLDTINKLLDTSRKIDMQPVYALNMIAEGGFNLQKELQGAIMNDKAMIDAGQVVLKDAPKEQEVVDVAGDLALLGDALMMAGVDELVAGREIEGEFVEIEGPTGNTDNIEGDEDEE